MKAIHNGTPEEKARYYADWREAGGIGVGRCDGCARVELPTNGNGKQTAHCPWLNAATLPNATCEFHSPISFSQQQPPQEFLPMAHQMYEDLPTPGEMIEVTTPIEDKALPTLKPATQAIQTAVLESAGAFQALGRIQAAQLFTTVGERLIAETAIQIKESKQFKDLPYTDTDGNIRQVGTFEEFCRVFLGKSYTRTQELISNYHLLGPALYEQAEKVGMRQRDYNALKALPAEDQAIVKDAIEAEDRSRVIDLLQEMAVKHGKEKEAHAKEKAALEARLAQEEAQAAVARADLAAKDGFIAKQAETIMDLQDRIEEKKNNPPDPLTEARAAVKALDATVLAIYADISTLALRDCLAVQAAHGGNMAEHGRTVIAQALGRIMSITRAVATDLDIVPDEDAPSLFASAAGDDETALWERVNRDLDAQQAAKQGK